MTAGTPRVARTARSSAGGSAIDAADHGKVVLSAIFGYGSVKALDYALARISPHFFVDPVQQALFTLAQRYADQSRAIMPRAALEDLLRSQEPGKALMYGEYYDALACQQPHISDFVHSVGQLRELSVERATGEALAQGMEILRAGVWSEDGKKLQGPGDARAHVLAAFSVVEREAAAAESPEGDARTEERDMLALYAKAKAQRAAGTASGVMFGLPELDEKLPGGLLPGEMALVLGFTSSGKTAWCCSWAWHAVTQQGRNVVIFTSETLRPQLRVKIASRHSRDPRFGLAKGLNSRDIRAGTLKTDEESALRAVLDDFSTNPGYGKCYIVQVPRGFTVSGVEGRLNAIDRQFHPDLVIIDYAQLLRSGRARKDTREEQGETVKDCKELAATFRGGHGVPLVSPWQVNREGRKAMKERGGYSLLDTAETAEAANTPDLILSLADPDADTSRGRAVHMELGVPKNRDGERGTGIQLTADFATSYFAARDRSTDESVLFGEGS
jgi:replicative DNA helicase